MSMEVWSRRSRRLSLINVLEAKNRRSCCRFLPGRAAYKGIFRKGRNPGRSRTYFSWRRCNTRSTLSRFTSRKAALQGKHLRRISRALFMDDQGNRCNHAHMWSRPFDTDALKLACIASFEYSHCPENDDCHSPTHCAPKMTGHPRGECTNRYSHQQPGKTESLEHLT